ncbi:maestro heat-like repeat-containing protein family member 7 isoform X2 [Lacerta agilis]|uniref:maestro heat-like repeat-containing protein family member 7 isoform X2 n=1 Tax=Lacerta agilis TaxID=80427 RepID=UPI00141A4688|nr:maestro heat-like repeat-containing protein family member 7 isoform X2 [Lacerta agilis]
MNAFSSWDGNYQSRLSAGKLGLSRKKLWMKSASTFFQVQKQEANLQRFLYQDLYYTQSELLPIKRASIVFLGFLVQHMDSKAGSTDLEMIIHALEGFMHDPDASVCIAAAHAHERVSSVISNQKERLEGNSIAESGDSAAENTLRCSRALNSIRHTPSRLLAVINLWRSANGN